MLNLDDYRDEYGCINLDKIELRDSYKEISGSAKKMWKILPDGISILFKEAFRFENPSFRLKKPWPIKYEFYSSLFEAEVAEFLGIPTAKYDLAVYQGKRGVITYDITKPGEIIIPGFVVLGRAGKNELPGLERCYRSCGCEYNIVRNIYPVMLDYLNNEDCARKISNEFMLNFYVLDFILTETDRNDGNWGLIFDGDSTYSLTPRFDSDSVAIAFRGETFVNQFLINSLYYGSDKFIDLHYSKVDFALLYDGVPKSSKKDFEIFCRENLEFAKKSFELISKIDVKKIFGNMEKKIHAKIPTEYKKWVSMVTTHQIELIKKIIEMTEDLNKDVSMVAI